MLIVGAIELGDGNIPGRLRLAEISSYGAADLGHFVETAADPDAIAKTDGWSGYAAVPADRHNVHVVGKTAAHLVLPWIHQVFSNLKGWARTGLRLCWRAACRASTGCARTSRDAVWSRPI